MSYTYDEPVDGVFDDQVSQVRYLVGDTSPAGPYSLSDAEIQYEAAQTSSGEPLVVDQIAANVAYAMGDRYSRESATSKSVGNLSLSRDYASLAGRYYAKASALRSGRNRGRAAVPLWNGVPDPQFYLGQFDYSDYK